MLNKIVKLLIPCLLFAACQKKHPKIKSTKGKIDIITNLYFDVSKGVEVIKSFNISRLNYQGNDMIDLVPNLNYPNVIEQVYFIKDTFFLDMGTLEQAKKMIVNDSHNKWLPIAQKRKGIVFFYNQLSKYSERKDISDTILFNKKYKRFEIDDKNSFARYYIYQTDTITPYSLNPQIDKDYNGRLERIDSYLKDKDIFITFQLFYSDKIDEEAQEIFDFQDFVNKQTTSPIHKMQ